MLEYSHQAEKNRSELTCSEVMPMDGRARILAIRLMEMIQKDPAYAQTLGLEADMKEQCTCSMSVYLHAEGLTEL